MTPLLVGLLCSTASILNGAAWGTAFGSLPENEEGNVDYPAVLREGITTAAVGVMMANAMIGGLCLFYLLCEAACVRLGRAATSNEEQQAILQTLVPRREKSTGKEVEAVHVLSAINIFVGTAFSGLLGSVFYKPESSVFSTYDYVKIQMSSFLCLFGSILALAAGCGGAFALARCCWEEDTLKRKQDEAEENSMRPAA